MLLAACAPSAPAPAASGSAAASGGASSGAPAAAPPAAPAASAEWDRVLAAAKQEGKVAVIGPQGNNLRPALADAFESRYGISVELLQSSSRDSTSRIQTERAAGRYLWDLIIGGTTSAISTLGPMGALDPIEPALILPEVADLKNWRGGALDFADDDRRVLAMTTSHRGTLFVNPRLVNPQTFKSYRDLLDPRWKGQLVADDPRVPGPGLATFTLFYLHPNLGPDFIRALVAQDLSLMRDYRQEADAVGQGRAPVLIGGAEEVVLPLIGQGAPIVVVDPRQLDEKSDVNPSYGSVSLFNQAAHPNAAKVYLNWLLSKDGQTEFARATEFISGRQDVPTDHALAWRVPVAGAVRTYHQQAVEVREEVQAFLNEVLGR
jgi:iron(III) transport system substrate-binding protein